MTYDTGLADRVRAFLAMHTKEPVTEKKMFSGLAFLVNDKMCVNISHDRLMCRFDPSLHDDIAGRKGFLPMVMKGKELKGYCYVTREGFLAASDFETWLRLCLDYNPAAHSSKKTRRTKQ